MIVTSGTITGKWEDKYVRDAVKHLGDPEKFNFYIKEFERRFAEYVGSKYAIATVNGTAALHLGLLALGIGRGDEVILPDMTYIACANVIHYVGATPVFVDIDVASWCLDFKKVKQAITSKTKAIMPVWMYGNAPDMNALLELGIPLIEDSCPAVGSYFRGKHAGTFGRVGCFSFQGAKVLAIGEGGMLVTDDERIYKEAKLFADMYTVKEFWQSKIGYMYEMNNVSAAVGLGQLKHIKELLDKKRQIFNWYKEGLDELRGVLFLNQETVDSIYNYWMSSIVVSSSENRNKLRKFLKEKNIDTRPFFQPISSLGLYKYRYNTIVSRSVGNRGINLPSKANLTKRKVDYVISQIKIYYQKNT